MLKITKKKIRYIVLEDELVAHLCRGDSVRPYPQLLCSLCPIDGSKAKNLTLREALNYAALIARNS